MRAKNERADNYDDEDRGEADVNKNSNKKAKIAKKKTDIVNLPTPVASNYNCEHLLCTAETASRTLAQFGVAIVQGVLNQAQCDAMYRGMWSFVERVSKGVVSEADQASWLRFNETLLPSHSMLMQYWGIGHAPFAWEVRQNPAVIEVFSRLWNKRPEDLLVSFDGSALHLPHEATDKGEFKGRSWMHLDQRLSDPSFQCVQGWVTALDVNALDATLAVYEGSHRHVAEFARRFGLTGQKTDWYKLADNDEHEFFSVEKECPLRCIQCPAGSLVLWDSRTIHQGMESIEGRSMPNTRCVTYVCYTPRSKASAAELKRKREDFETCRTTNHWPHRPRVFGKAPQTYGKPLPDLDPLTRAPELTPLGRRLAGYE